MNIKKGDILSRTSYMEVLSTNPVSTQVSNGRDKWSIDNHILTGECKSATWYNEEKTLSRTSVCEILESTNGAVFSVTFTKQITVDQIVAKLRETDGNEDAETKANYILQGEERTLIGYLVDTKQEFGRYKVVDLELQFKDPKGHNLRQVDSKTISELVYNGVKYKCKK